MLDIAIIYDRLKSSRFKNNIFYFDSIDSTNTEGMSNSYPFYSIIIAGRQLSGKGRSGRIWESLSHGNLYVSFVLPPIDVNKLLPLNIVTGFAVADSLNDILNVKLKWPNDLVIKNKKLGGILLETKFTGNKLEKIVVGIGINVNQTSFDNNLSGIATSIYAETGKFFEVADIACKVIKSFEYVFENFLKNNIDIVEKWCNYTNNLNKKISVHINNVKKFFIEAGITDSGELIVLDENGEKKVILLGDIDL
jgi:BirA family biotin operon repressor/biotin-[acetyl-CoA-carboxylase] ligase